MSQEQIVIAGVVALNLVLLVLLVTAYRLLAARTQPQHEQPLLARPLHAAHTQHTHAVLPTEAEEIQGLEALFAHDSWPGGRFGPDDQFSARAIDGTKE